MLVRSDKAWDYAIGMLKSDGLEPRNDGDDRERKAR